MPSIPWARQTSLLRRQSVLCRVIPSGSLAVDLHVHTIYSRDSLTSLPSLVVAVQRRGLSAVAITDHNETEGALRLRDIAPFPVIVGEEILTSDGEIIGLFLERKIPRRLSPLDTIAAIHEQGGLVYLPHPGDGVRHAVMRSDRMAAIIGQVDAVEVLNARVLFHRDNEAARRLADTHGIPHGAGSDAHTAAEIGQAYVLLPECDLTSPRSFLAAVRQGQTAGRLSSPLVHLASTVAKVVQRLGLASGRSAPTAEGA